MTPTHDPREDGSGAREPTGYAFLRVFGNDDVVDAGGLAMLERIALRDGKVDADEARVLATTFGRVGGEDVEPEVWSEMQRFREASGS